MSGDVKTAQKVAARRHGESIIYKVDAEAMVHAGYRFFQSVNGVWLTDHVPAKYLN